MSDEGKEAPAVGLGFDPVLAKKYRADRLARPSHWSPGVRVQSAEEYERYTEQLVQELLVGSTPDRLAIIAAQHMMYADELKCVLEEEREKHTQLTKNIKKSTKEAVIKISTEVAMTTLEAYRENASKKRADAVAKKKEGVKALARQIATELWKEDSEQKIQTGRMAAIVFDALKQTEHSKLVISVGAVREWITPCAPPHASKPGPGKKY